MEIPKAIIPIDDSYSSQSTLECEIDEDLQRIFFFARTQHESSTFFQLYPENINKLMDFLVVAKQYFKID